MNNIFRVKLMDFPFPTRDVTLQFLFMESMILVHQKTEISFRTRVLKFEHTSVTPGRFVRYCLALLPEFRIQCLGRGQEFVLLTSS
jgi:hypothetical protein